jgi:dihydropteroate synthase
MIFRAGKYKYEFPRPALVWGVVNVTPDSFSDGGRFFDREAAVARAEELAEQGAEVIDVGGESTRPNAGPVSEAEELRRVIPVIEELAGRLKIAISVDTMKPAVALAAVAAGASIVNDVGANREDPAMWRIVAETGAGYVAMHMQGTPQTMQAKPVYGDVAAEVREFFRDRLKRLEEQGVAAEQVALDVGIGFGKTLEHNLQLLAELESFTNLARPMLLGISRKSFLGKVYGDPGAERLSGALAGTALARSAGAQMFRTHDVAATVQALRMTEAVLAHKR